MKAKRIELRNDDLGRLDEVVVRGADFVHFERMDDGAIWCGIDAGKRHIRIWISSKNGRAHVNYTAETEIRELPKKKERRRHEVE